jgi:membrane protein
MAELFDRLADPRAAATRWYADSALAGVALAFVEFSIPYPTLVGTVILLLGLTVGLLPIYYVLTPTDTSIGDVLPGTVLAAVGWAVLQSVFQVYVSLSSTAELYGVIGAVILFITWLYFGSLVVLLGATVNVVLDRDAPSTQPQE